MADSAILNPKAKNREMGRRLILPVLTPSARGGSLPGRQHHMKTFSKTFAVIALVWAILSPPLLPVLYAADGIGPLTRL